MQQDNTRSYQKHDHGDDAWNHTGESVPVKSLAAASVLTLGFSAVELGAGVMGNSLALIGDAGHMATDSASLLFALLAAAFSRKGADSDHSFGHGRIEVLAAFVNSLAMVVLVGWLFAEAVGRISSPQPVSGGTVMTVAMIGLVINGAVAWVLARGEKTLNTRAAFMHVLGDLLGSLAAISAGALVYFGGESFAIADPILSFAVCLLLVHSLWGVMKESVQVLIEAVRSRERASAHEGGQRLEQDACRRARDDCPPVRHRTCDAAARVLQRCVRTVRPILRDGSGGLRLVFGNAGVFSCAVLRSEHFDAFNAEPDKKDAHALQAGGINVREVLSILLKLLPGLLPFLVLVRLARFALGKILEFEQIGGLALIPGAQDEVGKLADDGYLLLGPGFVLAGEVGDRAQDRLENAFLKV